ncbi:MAG: cytochrome c biogenesis protein CcsA, partial [Armatimonadetes bacterium]|nr:cytochrome c biogenesis protein CcsA [Armatimonadota bacterium]
MSDTLPALEQIDRHVYRAVAYGFPLLTLVIITGAVWAQYVWQRWWSWDPKETASLVTWLVYAGYLHGRRQRNWTGKTSATIVLVGFLAVLFTFAGVNFLQ